MCQFISLVTQMLKHGRMKDLEISIVIVPCINNLPPTFSNGSMFVESCKRVRLMKSSEAIGLGNNVFFNWNLD